jgi:hypothetical protein
MKRFKRIFIISFIVITVLVVVVIACISPITKYLVEKYDVKYSGREISMSSAYVNPFTGFVRFNQLKIKEFKSDSLFLTSDILSFNFGMLKLLYGNYEVDDIRLYKPVGTIVQNNKYFNFNDLILKFSAKDKVVKSNKKELHLSLLNIKIEDGTFYYKESLIPISYFIKKVNIKSPGFYWDLDTIATHFEFSSGPESGEIKGNLNINTKNLDYRGNVDVKNFNLSIIQQYLDDISNFGKFSAYLDANMRSTGNFIRRDSAELAGNFSIDNFHLGKTKTEDFVFFKKLTVSIKRVNPSQLIYLYDSISLKEPYIKYERYDYLDNFQTMFGDEGAAVINANANPARFNLILEVAKQIKFLSRNFFKSNYKIGRIAVYKGDLVFNDYSLTEKFTAGLYPLNMSADTIDKRQKRVYANVNSGIKPYGSCNVSISINPKDSSDFDLRYSFKNLSAAAFNPYILRYTSFALNKGIIDVNGNWHVRNGNIQSRNNLLIVDPRVADRSRQDGMSWVPMRLAMFFVRESGNAIDYEVPVSGKLDDVNIHWKDVILDILMNLLVKPITTPYRMHVKNVEIKTESSMAINWPFRQNSLEFSQRTFLKKLAKYMENNPNVSIGVVPQQYTLKEREHLLFFEAKKKYYLSGKNKSSSSLSKNDSIEIERLSVKDKGFIKYLNKTNSDSMKFTVQEKCLALIGSSLINSKIKFLNSERKKEFISFFNSEGVASRIKFYAIKDVVPFNGFSYYKIDYKGEIPEEVLDAYRNMNRLNKEEPRSRFKRKFFKGKDK